MHDYLNKRQIKAVEALEQIKSICDKHDIQYYLLAGSVLGAVRHQGFIPWDDDIDIGVKYKDWYSLRKILIEELSSEFVYMDNILNPNFPRFQGKILYEGEGVIDVFLLANWTSNKLLGYIHWQIRGLAQTCTNLSTGYSSLYKTKAKKKTIKSRIIIKFREIVYFFLKNLMGKDDFIKLARWNERCFINKKTDFYINLYSVYSMEKEMIKKEWLESISLVNFEGETYSTVSNTDAYLTHLYGDYMVPPSKERRNGAHEEKFVNSINHK